MTAANTTMRSLERAFDVIEVLEAAAEPLRLKDLADGTGLHASTVIRLVSVLMRRGYVEQDGAGRYRLGPLFLTGAHGYLVTDTRSRLAQPILASLATTTGLTASFYVQHDLWRILVARVDGARPLSYDIPIGRKLPLHVGGGKPIVAEFEEAEFEEFLAQHAGGLDHADGTGVSEQDFRDEIAAIRAQGYHLARGEREPGVVSLSVPVHPTRQGTRRGALVIATRAEGDADGGIGQWISELKTAARAVENIRE